MTRSPFQRAPLATFACWMHPYDRRRHGRGAEFVAAVDEAITKIIEAPG